MDAPLPAGWTEENNALVRTIPCTDFVEALARSLEIGRLAERANHHPDLGVGYRQVRVTLCTHSAGHQITAKDLELATQIEAIDPETVHRTAADIRNLFQP